jgi:hypothetical protein
MKQNLKSYNLKDPKMRSMQDKIEVLNRKSKSMAMNNTLQQLQ